MKNTKIFPILFFALFLSSPLFGQDEAEGSSGTGKNDSASAESGEAAPPGGEEDGAQFSMNIELGAQTFNEEGDEVTYQNIGLYPDFAFGKVGIGLGLRFNFLLVDSEGNSTFEIREEDWIPEGDRSFLDIYLPIFRYVRYGRKGDPIYGKIGSIDNGTLGNGFIMGNYSNTLLLPEHRYVGLAFDLDGKLLDFPYAGIETFTGNLAEWDVIGTRLYTRPLVSTELPLLPELQIGSTFAADRNPDAIYDFTDKETGETYSPDSVQMFSFDLFQPIIATPMFSSAFYGDAAFQPGPDGGSARNGVLTGFGGKTLKFITYSINTMFLGNNFVPFYFDGTYDLYRQDKYEIYSGKMEIDGYAGWMAGLGFSFFKDSLVFYTSLDSSFKPESGKDSTYPHLRSTFSIGEGLLPGIYFDITYDKKYIKEFEDFGDPKNSVVFANIHYKTGPAIITLGYTLRYLPVEEDWETTARLSTSISF